MRRVVGIQARTGSSRLPGKVLMRLGDSTMLDIVASKCTSPEGEWDVIVLTTTLSTDDAISDAGHEVRRGSENDVLSRYMDLVDEGYDRIMRVCADAPFIRPSWISRCMEMEGPVFVPSVLHVGDMEDWHACYADIGEDEHAGHDWFEKNSQIVKLAPASYRMVNTEDDLRSARDYFDAF